MSVNTTPSDAYNITTLPAAIVLDPSGNPIDPTYIPDCLAVPRNAIWLKYTAKSTDRYLAIYGIATSSPSNYEPSISIWTGTIPSLSQLILGSGADTQHFCGETAANYTFMFPVTPGVTYYFQVANEDSDPVLGSTLTFQAVSAITSAVPAGSIVITDDTDDFPAAVIDPSTGQFINWIDLPAGETAAVLPNGIICLQNGSTSAGQKQVALYTSQLELIDVVDFITKTIFGITCDQNANFYIATSAVGPIYEVHKINSLGVLLDSWTLDSSPRVCTISRDGSIFYYGNDSLAGGVIKRYDLVADTPLSNLTSAYGTERLKGLGCGYVDDDGNIWFAYSNNSNGLEPKLRGFQPDGTLIATYLLDIGNIKALNRWVGIEADDNAWLWGGLNIGNVQYFAKIDLSTGAISDEFGPIGVSGSSGQGGDPFAISNSCPIFTLTQAIEDNNVPTSGSGIYRLTPEKRTDTIYVDWTTNPVTAIPQKLPDPFFYTYLIGDE